MVTRRQVLQLIDAGTSYEAAAAQLGIAPGLAYFIATGLPADGGESLAPQERERPGYLATSTQRLANPAPVSNPTHHDEVRAWMRRRAEADVQMQHAAVQQRVSPPAGDAPDDEAGLIDVLRREHNHVSKLMKELKRTPGATKHGAPDQIAARADIVNAVRDALTRHEAVEEQQLWPAVRNALGDSVVRAAMAQEAEAKETLAELETCPSDAPRFDELVEQLERRVRTHVAFEDVVFLGLVDAQQPAQRSNGDPS